MRRYANSGCSKVMRSRAPLTSDQDRAPRQLFLNQPSFKFDMLKSSTWQRADLVHTKPEHQQSRTKDSVHEPDSRPEGVDH